MTSTVEDRVLFGLDELTTNASHVYICDAASRADDLRSRDRRDTSLGYILPILFSD
jgi:hypothetical protein